MSSTLHRRQTIPQLFAVQVAARPDAVAVCLGAQRMSYAELDARANRVASWLRLHAVGAEAVVAIELGRCPDLIAVLLGVLKAGAAYLGLERDLPAGRRERVFDEARPAALVTGEDQTPDYGLPTLRVPGELTAVLPCGASPEPDRSTPDAIAYVSYTSGSTGRPKGVAVPHRAVARLVGGDYADLGADQTFLHLSPLSFDAATFEIWAALLNGARLAVHPPGPLSVEDLVRILAEERVSTLWLSAGLFHRVVDHHLESLAGLHQLLAGGDVLSPAHVNRVVDRFPGLRLVNGYGPTENTTFTCCHRISGPVTSGSVPIGRPITGTEVRILDARLRPVPPGVEGELYAAGAGLARGYLAQAALTAQSFVPDPFAATPGARMYRTGDIVRERPGGELEFLGRRDRQVKIDGFRVEPREAEREIVRHAGVGQVAVLPRPGRGPDGRRLVAYLVPDPASAQEPADLAVEVRRRLRRTLPAYLIPSAFVMLAELPLTPNGKIDVAALPVPQLSERAADTAYVPPRTPTEQLLCDLWAEWLNLDRVGVHDDFFELGGNSLLAMDLISRAEGVFEVELPVRALLYHPSVAEFARAVDVLLAGGDPG